MTTWTDQTPTATPWSDAGDEITSWEFWITQDGRWDDRGMWFDVDAWNDNTVWSDE